MAGLKTFEAKGFSLPYHVTGSCETQGYDKRIWGKAVFYGDLNQEDLEVFLFQIEKSMFYGQLNQED